MMNITRKIVNNLSCFAVVLSPLATSAETFALSLPNTMEEMFVQTVDQEIYQAPTGPWSKGHIKSVETNGRLIKRAWQALESTATVNQLAEPILEQLKAAGYQIIFDCHDRACGGFDFRFATDVLPAPYIYVNLQDFRFVTLKSYLHYKTVLISRMANTLSLQLIEVMTSDAKAITMVQPTTKNKLISDDIAALINQDSHAVLSDLEYESGSSKLGKGPFKSLSQVAKFLTDIPLSKAILVGHTDNVGSLESNILLSEQRATAVLERLGSAYGISLTRLSAKGVGYLAPMTSNSSKTGRELNRRVEFVLDKMP